MKIAEPLVSVLMPAYNVEKYLASSIQSILNQTYQNWELIIINDGSTDLTREICKQFEQVESRIKLFENGQNCGLIFTRNKALSKATGKYIANLDSDDLAFPNRLSQQVSFMESEPGYVMIGSACETIDENTKKTGEDNRDIENSYVKSLLPFSNYFINSSVMIRRSKIGDLKYEEGFAPAEDYRFFTRLMLQGTIGNLKQKTIQYRIHANNISSLKKQEQQQSIKRIQFDLLKKISIEPTKEEQNLHSHLVSELAEISEVELSQIEEWLLKLKSANDKVSFFESETFNHWCAFFYKRACLNAKLGVKSLSKFKQSELSASYHGSLKSNLTFFVKSILKQS